MLSHLCPVHYACDGVSFPIAMMRVDAGAIGKKRCNTSRGSKVTDLPCRVHMLDALQAWCSMLLNISVLQNVQCVAASGLKAHNLKLLRCPVIHAHRLTAFGPKSQAGAIPLHAESLA